MSESLDELRNRIDKIDTEMLRLFSERVKISESVAGYKKDNKLSILQPGREKSLIDGILSRTEEKYKNAARMMFTAVMDVSKCVQSSFVTDIYGGNDAIPKFRELPLRDKKVVCQGISGSYSDEARKNLKLSGGNFTVEFLPEFSDVFDAVCGGTADFGVLPIENSSVGAVSTYDFMRQYYNFYIYSAVRIRIEHVLAVKKGTALNDIKTVYSHEQALRQCSHFLRGGGYSLSESKNTAVAAKTVCESEFFDSAAICSRDAAKLYNLDIAHEDIMNSKGNSTRFIAITKYPYRESGTNTNGVKIISLALVIPNVTDSLHRMLMRFSYCGLNLLRIHSRPLNDSDVIFYLDFHGDVENEEVHKMLNGLKHELSDFRFLGNYTEI